MYGLFFCIGLRFLDPLVDSFRRLVLLALIKPYSKVSLDMLAKVLLVFFWMKFFFWFWKDCSFFLVEFLKPESSCKP